MALTFAELSFAARAPDDLAQFWAQALGWNVRAHSEIGVELAPADPSSFHLLFQADAEEKLGQNPIHFDLTTTSLEDQQNTVTELLAIGARHIDVGQQADDTHVVLADPEGNEFCVIEPDNVFLAGCPRLGAVNCDGTKQLGYFFSAAIGWPLVWDQNDETAIQAPDRTGPKVTWSGPPLMPKSRRERLHFHLAAGAGSDQDAGLEHLLTLGASRLDVGHACPGSIPLTDVDGNQICFIP